MTDGPDSPFPPVICYPADPADGDGGREAGRITKDMQLVKLTPLPHMEYPCGGLRDHQGGRQRY